MEASSSLTLMATWSSRLSVISQHCNRPPTNRSGQQISVRSLPMVPMRRLAAALVASVVALTMGASFALAQTSNAAVTIADFQFTPATLQVAQGTTVTWTNNGPTNHTTTSDSGAWDSGALQAGKSFSFKFNTPGTFAYHCSIHPSMKGTITVAAASSSPAAAPTAAAATSPSPSTNPAAASPSPSTSPAASSPSPSAPPAAPATSVAAASPSPAPA